MQNSLLSALLVATLFLPLTAQADTIDDFVLSGDGHTITYSLPATSPPYPDFNLFNFFQENTTATIDGVAGYSISGLYYLPFYPGANLILSGVPASIDGSSLLRFTGPTLFTYVTKPAQNPPGYLDYNIIATFTPGTYSLLLHIDPPVTFPISFPPPEPVLVPYTLTITEETPTASTPEPSTIVLFATGVLGLLALVRSRRRSPQVSRG